ncbi:MAG: AbiV family abortive infection protein [Candidatus Parcubacteria bacterium]|nr:AbiV family abortive infection protein [Candidatus Parcubacteria bacterium]
MGKIDKIFVSNNIENLINESFKNSERLFADAKILRKNQSFCSSLFLSISALEELSKWHFLKQNNVDLTKLEKITNHNFKIDEILEMFKETNNNPLLKKEGSAWLKNNRIKEMREDVLYVRLKERDGDKKYPIFPDEKYWQKRSKAMIKRFKTIFDFYKK